MSKYVNADKLLEIIKQNDYFLTDCHNSRDRGMFTIGIKQAINESPSIEIQDNNIPKRTYIICVKVRVFFSKDESDFIEEWYYVGVDFRWYGNGRPYLYRNINDAKMFSTVEEAENWLTDTTKQYIFGCKYKLLLPLEETLTIKSIILSEEKKG